MIVRNHLIAANHTKKNLTMKKIYIKPSITVEETVLPALLDSLSSGTVEFGGGNGGSGEGNPSPIPEAKSFGFRTFDIFDDEDDYDY